MISVWILILIALATQPSPGMLRELFEQELKRCRAQFGEMDVRTAQAARDLGLFLAKQGDTKGALAALTEAVRVDEKTIGPTASRTLADVAELAALSETQQAVVLWQRAATSFDASISSPSLAALAELRRNAGDRETAAKLYRQSLIKEQLASGRDSLRVASRLNALSLLVQPAEGVTLLERALRITIARIGAHRLETASIQTNLASLLVVTDRPARAATLAREAVSTFEDLLGPDHLRTAESLIVRGHTLRATGNSSAAEQMFRRALAIEESTLGLDHPQTLATRRLLAELLNRR